MADRLVDRLPEWVQPYIIYWRKLLHLEHIEIRVRPSLAPHDNHTSAGSVKSWPAYNISWIEIRADVEDDREWRQCVIHEVLHVAHARVDAVVWDMLLPRLGHDAAEIGREAYRHAMESFIDSLSLTLLDLDMPVTATVEGASDEGSNSGNENIDNGSDGTPRRSSNANRTR